MFHTAKWCGHLTASLPAPVVFGQICGKPAMFLPRHGYGHTIPPHMVNYRANLWALHHHKATGVISVASVGGIRNDLQPGDIVLPNQIIDYTWGRKSTFSMAMVRR
jgi:purine nucleoside phosphorylase